MDALKAIETRLGKVEKGNTDLLTTRLENAEKETADLTTQVNDLRIEIASLTTRLESPKTKVNGLRNENSSVSRVWRMKILTTRVKSLENEKVDSFADALFKRISDRLIEENPNRDIQITLERVLDALKRATISLKQKNKEAEPNKPPLTMPVFFPAS